VAKKWGIKANKIKSVHVTFIARKETCPPVILNGLRIPQAEDAKYLARLRLDRRLNREKHIFTKQKQFGLQAKKMYRLLGSKSQLSTENKLLLYKAIFKPIWASNCGARPPIQI